MIGDRLLEWMTHVGSGPWDAFREAADELDDVESRDDAQKLHRVLRIALSDFGHADFFVNGSRRWRVRRPALAELTGSGGGHLFIGGRTRELLDQLKRLCRANGEACMTVREEELAPSRVRIEGEPDCLREAAEQLGIQYLPKAAQTLAARLTPMRRTLNAAEEADEPINWCVRSWSFRNAHWMPGRDDRTIREYTNRYGQRRHLVSVDRGGTLKKVELRAGMYCAATVRGEQIAKYSSAEQTLRVPLWAPLPAEHARAACLSGGLAGSIGGGNLVFREIDWQTASTLLRSLGQAVPMPGTAP
ncbi:MAG: hypothetical protein OXU81_09540 [Gammaproteobacteria bacterium]|nr:hypothetical protein [Gammaproteobacteria bacterium]